MVMRPILRGFRPGGSALSGSRETIYCEKFANGVTGWPNGVGPFDGERASFLFREFSALVEELVNLDEAFERGTPLPVGGTIAPP